MPFCDKRRKQPKKLSEITEKVYNLGRDIEKYCTFVDILCNLMHIYY